MFKHVHLLIPSAWPPISDPRPPVLTSGEFDAVAVWVVVHDAGLCVALVCLFDERHDDGPTKGATSEPSWSPTDGRSALWLMCG